HVRSRPPKRQSFVVGDCLHFENVFFVLSLVQTPLPESIFRPIYDNREGVDDAEAARSKSVVPRHAGTFSLTPAPIAKRLHGTLQVENAIVQCSMPGSERSAAQQSSHQAVMRIVLEVEVNLIELQSEGAKQREHSKPKCGHRQSIGVPAPQKC